jgi:hypothetical protein
MYIRYMKGFGLRKAGNSLEILEVEAVYKHWLDFC